MYAVIQTGGKQYRIEKDEILDVELLGKEAGENVSFDKVLLIADNGNLKIGRPCVENARVEAKLLENVKDKKVVSFKFKNKTGYRKTKGHRQQYSRVQIKEISNGA